MSDDHDHHTPVSNLKLVFFLNAGFALVEFVGGLWTNSTAIMADAIHDLGDSFALAQAWYFETLSSRGATAAYTYGYRRFSLLGAVVSAFLLLGSCVYVVSEAVPRIADPERSDAAGMVALAVVGVAVNGFAALRMRGSSGANARVIALHLLEDVLGWVAVLVVAVVLLFTDLHVLDPILAVLIAVWVLVNVVRRLRAIAPVFLQAAPADVDAARIERALLDLERVASVHHLHVWSLDGERTVLSAHVVTDGVLDAEAYAALKRRLRDVLADDPVDHSTFEVEWPDEACRLDDDCEPGR